MSAFGLTMSGAALESIVSHCRRELPNEACGILGGRDGRVESVHPVRNASADPSRFAMDPTEQYRALEAVSRAGRRLTGIYHSHPAGPAVPSTVDVEESCWSGTTEPNYPGAVQVIVSLEDRTAPVVRGYAPTAGLFVEVPVTIERNGGPEAPDRAG